MSLQLLHFNDAATLSAIGARGEDPATVATAEDDHRELAVTIETHRREWEMIDRLGWDGYLAWLSGDRQQLPLPLPVTEAKL